MAKSRRYVAYHEAGHAVACFLLRRKFRHVTIVPEKGAAGHLLHAKNRMQSVSRILPFERVPHRIDVELMVSLAGDVAQRKGSRRSVKSWHASSDQVTQIDFFASVNWHGWEAYLEYCQARLRAMFNDRFTWAGVKAVAEALIERQTLPYQEAKKIFFDASNEAFQQRPQPISR